jgi:hypothetical protein
VSVPVTEQKREILKNFLKGNHLDKKGKEKLTERVDFSTSLVTARRPERERERERERELRMFSF